MRRSVCIFPESEKKAGLLNRITVLSFLLLFTFPIIPLHLANGYFMIFSGLTVISFISRPVQVHQELLRNLVFVVPFLPYFIEWCVSGFDPAALFACEKKVLFYAAPLVTGVFIKVTGFRNYRMALAVFSISVLVLTLWSVGGMLADGVLFRAESYMDGAYLLRDSFENWSKLHPTYYAVFALCAAVFLFFFTTGMKKSLRVAGIVLMVVLLLAVLLLAVRVALLIAFIFMVVRIAEHKAPVIRKVFYIIGGLTLVVLAVWTVPSLNSRFKEVLAWNTGQTTEQNTISHRQTIWSCSMEVMNQNMLTGTGSRACQEELDVCYASKGWEVPPDRSYNPHNQFLTMGITYGIFTLICFLLCLFLIFRKALKQPEGKYFMIAVLTVFLSESILERQMGVYFFVMIGLVLYNGQSMTDSSRPNLIKGQ